MSGFWHFCLCEPAIVLAAWAEVDESGGVLSVINGEWYSYVVLPQPDATPDQPKDMRGD